MSPDIPDSQDLVNRLTQAQVWSQYYQNYNPDYKISDKTFGDPSNRKIRVISIGAGLFGINLAYWISVKCENFDLTVFEKSSELGGVWNHNRYPGVACDVPSHVYQYSFAPNPDWPRFLSPVLKAEWHEEGFWRVFLREELPNGDCREYHQDAEILVNNSGSQHVYQWPKVEGLDKFKGTLLHTAGWDERFDEEAWKNKTVAVIGSGASAVQVVPRMQQPHVSNMTVFSRTPIWFAPGLAGDEFSPEYSPEDRENFKKDPSKLQAHGKSIERRLNGLFPNFYSGTDYQRNAIKFFYDQMKIKIKDPRLLQGFTPEFVPGCRRITPGDPFIYAVQEPNVEVVFKGVAKLTEDGVVDTDGVERKVDAVVCATGFNVDLIPRFEVIGPNGLRISKFLQQSPDSYMSVALAQFPNYFHGSTGAYWPSANGSLIGPMDAVANYVVQVVQKLQMEHNIISVVPKQEAMDDFVEHAQTWLKGCITLQFVRALSKVRWEDYDIKYAASGKKSTNRFLYLGDGLVKETFDPEMDDSPHIHLGAIDPRWAKAAGLTFISGMRSFKDSEVSSNLKYLPDVLHGCNGNASLNYLLKNSFSPPPSVCKSASFFLLQPQIRPTMKFYDAQAPNPFAVRLFVLERGGLEFDVQTIDIMNLENRRLAYRSVNPRGEVPALDIDGFILTETTAICEYLDEVAKRGKSLFGDTALERAETRMWLRRMDLELAQPIIAWYRNDPDTIDFYKGNRIPVPEARVVQKVTINQFLNLLDDQLEGKEYLCGSRFSAADIHFYGLLKMMVMQVAGWVLSPGRKNVVAYFERMDARKASQQALEPFESKVSV
ncbi:sterigmatocystin biosynthesis monooxygenase stcW [Fusarium subglutinans]|uniref:Sterigmatocystin biosynthesis monooxygenase stcW n=1 Tax=Gibberella subglutinans TaxID=42677 RepID=A0A8H5P1T7_GIBSU|nr:sterigmatocystin biosynthesis monooxygenase stcW [Fusarium subglutinans]KAF5585023.1 sterigmatocystin biosynthesis monooxygenase stcW [Fusarium subglutinans]